MSFGEPIWLYALGVVLPALLLLFIYSERRARARLQKFAASNLVASLAPTYSPQRRWIKAVLLLFAVALIFVALAQPRWGYRWEEQEGRGIDVLFALDTSRSMLAEDIRPNRLERSKLAILDLLPQLEGDRVGLIAFAGNAFLQCPLTLDYGAFRQTLDSLDTDVIPQQGTDIAAAIAEAQASFGKENSYKILVMITDGEDLEASGITRARAAAKEGVTIYAVGVGSEEGARIPVRDERGGVGFLRDDRGEYVRTSLDEETLQAITQSTDGFYARLGARGEGLKAVYDRGLQEIPPEEREAQPRKIPIERFTWFVAAALGLLAVERLVGTRRRRPRSTGMSIVLAITALLAFAPQQAPAQAREAQKAYRAGELEKAIELYQSAIEAQPEDAQVRYNLGVAQYESGMFSEAVHTFRGALPLAETELQAEIYYNLANSLFRLGENLVEKNQPAARERWLEALKEYRNAIALEEKNEDARANVDYVQTQLKQLPMYRLKVQAAPPRGGRVTGEGVFDRGVEAEITAKASKGYRFMQWEGEGVQSPDSADTVVTMDADHSVRAMFKPLREVKVTATPPEGGTVSGSGEYPEGEQTTISATSKDGYRFKEWNGPTANRYQREQQVPVKGDMAFEAVFEPAYELIIEGAENAE